MAKRILISGCSSGIGRALAAELAARGHHVIATARDIATLADLPVADRIALDVSRPHSVEAAARVAGDIDVLINNAGATIWGAVESPDEDDVQRLFDTNVFGVLRMLRAFLPRMRERRRGCVFHISSAVARRSSALLGHYAATKAALDAYSEALRIELAPFGIKVCIVSLGPVESSFGVNRKEILRPDYAAIEEGVRARVARSRTSPQSASQVAIRIADAIERGDPPLRMDGTGDAFDLMAQRAAMTDAAWEEKTLADIGLRQFADN